MSDLYRAELMDIYKNPTHMHDLQDSSVSVDVVNQFCGDTLKLELKVEGGKIVDAGFTGSMCMVSQVSADLIVDELVGKDLAEIAVSKEHILENFGDDLTTSRIKCALLIKEAIDKLGEAHENE